MSHDDRPLSAEMSLSRLIGRPGPPPLRIHHILVATAVAAVLLSITASLRHQDFLGLSKVFVSSWGATLAITTAVSVTLVGFGFAWRRSGRAFFDLPGHWLLLLQSMAVGLFVALALAMLIRAVGDEGFVELPLYVFFFGVNLILLVLNLYAAWKIADSLSWRLFFLVQGGEILLPFVANFFLSPRIAYFVFRGAPIAGIVLLAAAAIGDRHARRARDWPHWVGVVLPVAVYVSFLCRQA